MNRKVTAGLADYVEGGTMTPQGIQTASQILMEYQDLMKNLGFDQPHVFATASLRNISNTEDAVAQIQRTPACPWCVVWSGGGPSLLPGGCQPHWA